MKYIIYIIFFLYSVTSYSFKLEDSIYKNLPKIQKTDNPIIYNQLSRSLIESNPELCKIYADTALYLAKLNTNVVEEGKAYQNIGTYYFKKSEFHSALEFFNLARAKFLLINDKKGVAMALNGIGVIYDTEGDYIQSLKYFKNALQLMEEVDFLEGKAGVLNNIAKIYYNLKDYKQSLFYLNENLKIAEESKNQDQIISALNNINIVYLEQGDYYTSLDNYLKILNSQRKSNNKYDVARSLINIGGIHSTLKNYTEALKCYKEALVLCMEAKDLPTESSVYKEIGNVYFFQGDYNLALTYVEKSLNIANKLKLKRQAWSSYKLISEIYEKIGNHKQALENYKRYSSISDSIFSNDLKKQITDFQKKYEIANKDREIKILKKEKEIQELEINKKTNTLISVVIIFSLIIISGVLLFNRYRTKQNLSRILKVANIELIESNATKDKMFSLLAHDLKNPVSAIYGLTNHIRQEYNQIEKSVILNFLDQISDSAKSVLDVIENTVQWSLVKRSKWDTNIEKVKINALITNVFQLFSVSANRKGIHLISELDNELEFITDINMLNTVFRNIISNAIKFTPKNGTIKISAQVSEKRISISVKDTGVGISEENISRILDSKQHFSLLGTSKEKGSGLGLLLSKELIETYEGTIKIQSQVGSGTTVIIEFPTNFHHI